MFCLPLLPLLALGLAHHRPQDPTNGYEDYLQAARAVNDGYAELYYNWSPDGKSREGEQPARREVATQLKELDYLGVQTAMVKRYGPALDVLKAGNEKHVFVPWKDSDERPRLVSSFLALGGLCSADAYVRFANSDSKGATQSLLDGLTFAANICEDRPIELLVGYAIDERLFERFSQSLRNLSKADAAKVLAKAESILSKPSPLVAVTRRGRDVRLADLATVLAKTSGGETSLEKFVAGMTSRQRRDALERATDGIVRNYSELLQRLNGPESQWYVPLEPARTLDPQIGTVDDLVRALVNAFRPTDLSRFALTDLTQMRLLALHMRIIDYKWRYGRLPEELPRNLSKDPLTGGEFVYELSATGNYRLFSKGIAATGPIELGYRSQGGLLPGTVPPPQEGTR